MELCRIDELLIHVESVRGIGVVAINFLCEDFCVIRSVGLRL